MRLRKRGIRRKFDSSTQCLGFVGAYFLGSFKVVCFCLSLATPMPEYGLKAHWTVISELVTTKKFAHKLRRLTRFRSETDVSLLIL